MEVVDGRWGAPDALPSGGAGDSQPGTTFSSDRAVPGLPVVKSGAPPHRSHLPLLLTLCPLASYLCFTQPFFLFSFQYELVFHKSNCSFKFQLRIKDRKKLPWEASL